MAVVVKTNGIPFWGGCTTHFRSYFSGDWDVHRAPAKADNLKISAKAKQEVSAVPLWMCLFGRIPLFRFV